MCRGTPGLRAEGVCRSRGARGEGKNGVGMELSPALGRKEGSTPSVLIFPWTAAWLVRVRASTSVFPWCQGLFTLSEPLTVSSGEWFSPYSMRNLPHVTQLLSNTGRI